MPRLCSSDRKPQRSCNERPSRSTDRPGHHHIEPAPGGVLVHRVEAGTLIPTPLSPRCPHPDTRDDLVPDAFRRSPKLATGSSSPRKIGAECPKPISGQLYDQNLLPPPKFFLQKRAPQKATPFRGRNRFWTDFWERGHE